MPANEVKGMDASSTFGRETARIGLALHFHGKEVAIMSDANHEGVWSLWRSRLTWAAGGLILVGGGLWLRSSFGPEAAEAQAPASGPPAAAAPARPGSANPTAPAPTPAQTQQVVALVGNEQITRDELARACLARYGKEVMENLVNKQLILQACAARRLDVTKNEIDAEITRLAQRFGLEVPKWLKLLEEERHITPEQYKQDILWPTLALRKLAADQLVVSREELDKAYESEYGAKRKVRVIVIADKAKADQVRALAAASPAEFARIAKEQSQDGPSAAIGGLVPPVRKHTGDAELEKVVFGLKEGEVSQVVYVANHKQHFIIKCEQHIPATLVNPQYQAQITERITEQLREQKMKGAAGDIFKNLQKNAKVVNVFNDDSLRAQMPGVAGTINGQAVTLRQLGEECIARHGVEVLDGEINRKLLTQALTRKNLRVEQPDLDAEIDRAAEAFDFVDKATKTVNRKGWLDRIVSEEVKKTAEESGKPATTEISATERQSIIDLYVADVVWPTVALKKLVGGSVQVTQADLDLGFAKHYGERVDCLVIVCSDQRTATKVFSLAQANPTDRHFGELAKQYSIEPISRNNDGQVPPIRIGGGQPAIEKAAFNLRPGELSQIVAVSDKYILLRCKGRTKPTVELSVVRDELVKLIHEEKMREQMTAAYDNIKESASYGNFLTGEQHQPKRIGATGEKGIPRSAAAPVPNVVQPASANGPVKR